MLPSVTLSPPSVAHSMRPWPLLLSLLTLAASAQNNAPPNQATSTVTGHVYCADTNAPARMASVSSNRQETRNSDRRTAHRATHRPEACPDRTRWQLHPLRTSRPARYYVVAYKGGYLSPRPLRGRRTTTRSRSRPRVTRPSPHPRASPWRPDQTASIDVRLERGAAISGTVRFDDGSPASGVSGHGSSHRSKVKRVRLRCVLPFAMRATPDTDDLGHYRISGLPRSRLPGRGHSLPHRPRARRARLQLSPASSDPRSGFYSGDTPRISDAVPIKLGARRRTQRRRHHHPTQQIALHQRRRHRRPRRSPHQRRTSRH